MKISRLATLAVTLMLFMGAPLASAQDEGGEGLASDGYVGLLLGMVDPTNIEGRMAFGANAGLQFRNDITGSVFFLTSTADENTVDLTVTHFGLGADYNFAGQWAGAFAGLRVGMGREEVESETDSGMVFGPAVGYDYQVAPYLSLGGTANILWSAGKDVESALYAMASIKYWF